MASIARDKSSSPYYVEPRFCDGDKCVYTGVKIFSHIDIQSNTWTIEISKGDDSVKVSNTDITGDPSSVIDVVDQLSEMLSSESWYIYGLDVLCVPIVNDANPDGMAVIYVRSGYDVLITGDGAEHNIRYLGGEGEPVWFYHLCRNISLNFGECRQLDGEGSKNSNVYSEKTLVEEDAIWRDTKIPLILGNCMLCDYCIGNCPRKAIHNRVTKTSMPMRGIDEDSVPEGEYEFYRLYYRNEKALAGTRVLGDEYEPGIPGEIDGGEW